MNFPAMLSVLFRKRHRKTKQKKRKKHQSNDTEIK